MNGKMIKWVKNRLGSPLMDVSLTDETFEVLLEIIDEDLEIRNITITSKFNRNAIISRLLLAETKLAIGRVKCMYQSTWTLDYEKLFEEGHEEREVIYDLLLDN